MLTVKELLKYVLFFKEMSVLQRLTLLFHAEEFGFAIYLHNSLQYSGGMI